MVQPTLTKTQVIIVGAGPTGLSLGAQLIRFNIDFFIIEKNAEITHLSKALVVHARSMEIFREIGLTDKALKQGRITKAANVYYKGKQKVVIKIGELGKGLSPFPFTLSLEQSKTEKLLADHLAEKGKTIHWNSNFERFEETANGVKVYYTNHEGPQVVVGAYLVGCDGARSLVRHQIGLPFEGDTLPKLFYVTDVTLSSPVIDKDELFICLIKKGFVLFFPMEGSGHYRVIGILPNKTDEDEQFTFQQIEGFIKEQIVIPVDFKEVRWFSTYKVHTRKANSFIKGRCLIAGDAGHIHTPAGGQGMNTGIQDAYNLAWKLAYTIRYGVAAFVLESYDTEREQNARRLLKTTDRLFDNMAGVTKVTNFMRLHVIPLVAGLLTKNPFFKKKLFPGVSQIGIKYPDSALTIKSQIQHVNAGDRMPYIEFPDGSNIFDYLAVASFKVLFFGSGNNQLLEHPEKLEGKVYMRSFTEIPKELFGSNADFYILLRPDNHISYIGNDAETCVGFLEKMGLIKL